MELQARQWSDDDHFWGSSNVRRIDGRYWIPQCQRMDKNSQATAGAETIPRVDPHHVPTLLSCAALLVDATMCSNRACLLERS